jgi:hypothetical protein
MPQQPLSFTVHYRRTVRWTLCVAAVYALRAVGLRMPKRLLLWFARSPGQFRVGGGGRWQTVRLDDAELKRRFG